MGLPGHASAEPFFLEADPGRGADRRFCMFYPPAGECRGALVYVHPFAEEMNKSRRMAALTARALAARGIGVLQVDLYGCGDSSGEFADASWDSWKADLALATGWLYERLGCPVGLWGLRLGALLALDYAQSAAQPPDRLLLWQPVTSGASYLTQFLRLKLANDMLHDAAGKGGAEALRAALRTGSMLQIAGYDLAPALAHGIDRIDFARLMPNRCPVHWFELASAPGRPLSPVANRIGIAWRTQGVNLHFEQIAAQPFWATQEIVDCPALLEATASIYRQVDHA